jgi:sialic acid synthase SpsE
MDQENIRHLAELGWRFDVGSGLSEHTFGAVASVAAVALDRCVINI